MSLPDQIQRQLFGLPARLAGRAGTFTEGRTNTGLAGPVLTGPLTRSVDVLQPRSIGSDIELSMSAGNASLGHACVSPAPSNADHLATEDFQRAGETPHELGKTSQGESTVDA